MLRAQDPVTVNGKAGMVDRAKQAKRIAPGVVVPRKYLVLFDDNTADWYTEACVSPQATLEAFPGRKA